MKKMKKMFSLFLALALALGMSMTAFATTSTPPTYQGGKGVEKAPSQADKGLVKIEGVTYAEGVTATAYQIAEAKYDLVEGVKGFYGYQPVEAVKEIITDPTDITLAKLLEIHKSRLDSLTAASLEWNGTQDALVGELAAGVWMALISGSVDKVYSPIILSVQYKNTKDGGLYTQLEEGNVDVQYGEWELNGVTYAKSSAPTIARHGVAKINGVSTVSADSGSGGESMPPRGVSAALGDEIGFSIEASFPSYSGLYPNPAVTVQTVLDNGLSLLNGGEYAVVVSANGAPLTASSDYTLDISVEKFKVHFTPECALAHAGQAMTVTYVAKVNGNAACNYESNKSTSTLTYTLNPASAETVSKSDRAYVYTFGIGAPSMAGKSNAPADRKELINTGDSDTTGLDETVFRLTHTGTNKEYYTASGQGELVKNGDQLELRNPSDADAARADSGLLRFTQLSAGTYKLVEQQASRGYSLNEATYTIKINPAIDSETGALSGYEIIVKNDMDEADAKTFTYVAETGTDKDGFHTITGDRSTGSAVPGAYEIRNTSLLSLPSTGGIGTTIFTIGGCAVMILAAGLYFASRRKSSK